MNWNSKSTNEVAKEQIWKEFIRSEQQSVRIFDQYRCNSASLKRQAIASPVSNRESDFLDKTKVLFQSIYAQAGLRSSQSPARRSPSPAAKGSLSPITRSSAEGLSTLTSDQSPSRPDTASRGASFQSVESQSPVRLPSCHQKPPTVPTRSQSNASASPLRQSPAGNRPTSGSEYGSMLEPLVKYRFNPFHYGIRKSDVTERFR